MNERPHTSSPSSPSARRAALASPLRLEILGLFGTAAELSVSDMAHRLGRPATSLYHHIGVLEEADVLEVAGTRPKGKRFETLYRATGARQELELDLEDETARAEVRRTLSAAFRMAERDFEAALDRDDLCTEGPQRNLISFRMQMRATPEFLQELNTRLQAIEDLLQHYVARHPEPGPDDQFVSLTLALLPLRGRHVETSEAPPEKGTRS